MDITTSVVKINQLKVGDKFWFNYGHRGKLWVLDSIEKDGRFPNDTDPHNVWKIEYHLDIPNANRHHRHIDEQDTAVVIK